MIRHSFGEDGVLTVHDGSGFEATKTAKGLLIGLALSQVFWIMVGLAVIRGF